MFDINAIYLILRKNGMYYLYRRLNENERPDPDKYYRDKNGYRWWPLGSNQSRVKLEKCVEGYRTVGRTILGIAEVFKEGIDFEQQRAYH